MWLFYEMGTKEKVGNSTKFSFNCNKAAYFGISFHLLLKADCKLLKKKPQFLWFTLIRSKHSYGNKKDEQDDQSKLIWSVQFKFQFVESEIQRREGGGLIN